MATILLVEDDANLSTGLAFTLRREGYEVVCALSRAEADRCLEAREFDLLVLDVMLPDGSGFDLCRAARRRTPVPIIFLTARDEEVSVVRGLEIGADDYIAKPFRVRELVSRIAAVLRRTGGASGAPPLSTLRSGGLAIDLAASRVHRGRSEVRLSAEEFRLLSLLARHPGQTLERSTIMAHLLDRDRPFVDDNTLSVYVRRLREKVERDPSRPRLIVTVRGLGYRWEGGREPSA